MTHRATLIYGALLLGCVQRSIGGDSSESGTSSGTTGGETSGVPTTGVPATSSIDAASSTSSTTETSTGTSTTDPAPDDTCSSLCDDPTGPSPIACDVLAQDCPEGEKCAPFIEGDESAWNAAKCVPVMGEGQAGELCTTVEGAASGLDDCAKQAMCWSVDLQMHGYCIALCSGSELMPVCAEGSDCYLVTEVLVLCIPECDPLLQDCPGELLCISFGDTFVCDLDDSEAEGHLFGACELPHQCDKGLTCLSAGAANECDAQADGCCLPVCDLDDADLVCPGVGQVCVSLYEEGMAPESFEHVGGCTLPP